MRALEPYPFHFDTDVEVFEKSGEGDKERRIGGFVTTADLDQHGERLIQDGLDFSHFLSKGWFNDNHSRDTAGIVGYPELAERRVKDGQDGWYVEGYMLKGHKRADELWELANALQKSGRRLGYSVEGKILERQGEDGSTVARALVKNVAITNCPVNDKTALEVLAKSLDVMNKALAVGPANPAGPAGAPVTPGGGAPLIPESLDTGRKKKRKKGECEDEDLNPRSAQGGLTKSAGVAFILTRAPHLSVDAAERLYWAVAANLV